MKRSITCLFYLVFIGTTLSATAFATPPAGQSALLNGMHDIEATSWMKTATPGCDKGWLTDLRYIGTSGTPGVDCHQSATNSGISIIQRLDVSGTESYPRNPNQAPGYASAFAHYAKSCSNIHVWIVGNEPNFTEHKSDPNCTSAAYAKAYVAVHRAIHALPGHQQDLVLVASNSPYSPGCIESLRQIIREIQKAGVQPDGFALHAYTRATRGSQLNAGYVTDNKTQQDVTRRECPGNATWNDTWHSHFRIYMDYIKAIEAKGLAGRPVLITESGNACEPTIANNACYPNADVGYFQALYAEANRWNQLASTKTKIRAITPYRWTPNKDGTSRDFAIGKRPALLADLKKAFAKQYRWTTSKCGTIPGCTSDNDCPQGQRCQQGTCTNPTPGCASNSDCPPGDNCINGQCTRPTCPTTRTCNPNQTCSPTQCSDNPGQCIGKGTAAFSIVPTTPPPGTNTVKVSVTHPQGLTYIGLQYCGPTQGKGTLINIDKAPNGHFRWNFTIGPIQRGLYRIDFTSDNGNKIEGSTNLDVQPPCTPSPEVCDNKDNDCDGQIDEQLQRTCFSGSDTNRNQGECKDGTQQCNQGRWTPCSSEQLPTLEVCDNKDNDCDGQIDNGTCLPGEPTPSESTPEQSNSPEPTTNTENPSTPDSGVVILDSANGPTPRQRGCVCHASGGGNLWFGWLLLMVGVISLLTRRHTRQNRPR